MIRRRDQKKISRIILRNKDKNKRRKEQKTYFENVQFWISVSEEKKGERAGAIFEEITSEHFIINGIHEDKDSKTAKNMKQPSKESHTKTFQVKLLGGKRTFFKWKQ